MDAEEEGRGRGRLAPAQAQSMPTPADALHDEGFPCRVFLTTFLQEIVQVTLDGADQKTKDSSARKKSKQSQT